MTVEGMTGEVVVARYCEDMVWLDRLPSTWAVTVYDKSQGGPHDRLRARCYRSPDRPDAAPLHPGAVALPNVGGESHSYLTHLSTRYEALADLTVFTPGDPLEHMPDFIDQLKALVFPGAQFAAFGHGMDCDADGWPQHDRGDLPQLRQMHEVFWPGAPVPASFTFVAGCIFLASRARLQAVPRQRWAAAGAACLTRRHASGMERLWSRLLDPAVAVKVAA